ncbi:MAG: prephenate dehydrogenase [Flavobacterium sp.]
MKVISIGIGLIGGSLALNIKQLFDQATVLGKDINESHLKKALELGIIDGTAQETDFKTADLIIVSIPVHATAKLLPEILDAIGSQTLVMDVGSTKAHICQSVSGHPKRSQFLAMHPIAGTEFSGPEAALPGLFEGKTNIVCEIEKTAFKLQEQALKLFAKLGMRIRYMDPVAHDKHIAYVSHLSHISSFMLGKTVIDKEENEKDIFDLAGSGFESTVRLAKSSPTMWAPIFHQNKENVLESLEEYIRNLQEFKSMIEQEQLDLLEKTMQDTNKIKEILNGIQK